MTPPVISPFNYALPTVQHPESYHFTSTLSHPSNTAPAPRHSSTSARAHRALQYLGDHASSPAATSSSRRQHPRSGTLVTDVMASQPPENAEDVTNHTFRALREFKPITPDYTVYEKETGVIESVNDKSIVILVLKGRYDSPRIQAHLSDIEIGPLYGTWDVTIAELQFSVTPGTVDGETASLDHGFEKHLSPLLAGFSRDAISHLNYMQSGLIQDVSNAQDKECLASGDSTQMYIFGVWVTAALRVSQGYTLRAVDRWWGDQQCSVGVDCAATPPS